jgi:Ala-tRNA(Pro) deacylase
MPITQLKEFLDSERIKYVTIGHSLAYTAQETANSAHIPSHAFAKTVMIKVDGQLAMAVLPASHYLDTAKLRDELSAGHVELASEEEFAGRFPGCEIGAMPPFGNLYGMAVYVSSDLNDNESIAFNAGSHRELIQLAYRDFTRLVRPTVLPFGIERPAAERLW